MKLSALASITAALPLGFTKEPIENNSLSLEKLSKIELKADPQLYEVVTINLNKIEELPIIIDANSELINSSSSRIKINKTGEYCFQYLGTHCGWSILT